jgi:lactoylglutathione lyase
MSAPNPTEVRALQFAGVAVYVDDVSVVLEFYERAFGLKRRFFDPTFDYAELDSGETLLAITSHKTGEMLMPGRYERREAGQPTGAELAFFTSDVAGAFSRAVSAGAIPLAEPKRMPWGMTVAYVRSIEGTLIGLSTPPLTAKRPAEV